LVRWRRTAALFEIGKFLISFYIGKQGLESTYGASASIVVVLIWIYYTAQIVLFGAEFTHVRARQRGGQREKSRVKAGRLVRPPGESHRLASSRDSEPGEVAQPVRWNPPPAALKSVSNV
jgi:hypothetical protein